MVAHIKASNGYMPQPIYIVLPAKNNLLGRRRKQPLINLEPNRDISQLHRMRLPNSPSDLQRLGRLIFGLAIWTIHKR